MILRLTTSINGLPDETERAYSAIQEYLDPGELLGDDIRPNYRSHWDQGQRRSLLSQIRIGIRQDDHSPSTEMSSSSSIAERSRRVLTVSELSNQWSLPCS